MSNSVHAAFLGLEAVARKNLLSRMVSSSFAEGDDILIGLDLWMTAIGRNGLEVCMDDGQDLRPQLQRAARDFAILIQESCPVVEVIGQLHHVAALREVLKESTAALVYDLSPALELVVQLPPE